jgi:Putative prokaryotic signal transducing protein
MADDLVTVLVTQSWVEAEVTKGRLEAEGIPVHLKGVGEGPYPTGPNELFVPSTFEAQARRILEEIARGSFALQDSDEDAAGTSPSRDDR